jgi:hypothetical protein
MKSLVTAAATAAAFLAVPLIAAAAGPPYGNGPVWDCVQVRTKDGHFDDYVKWLATDWKSQQEAWMKAGYIIGYKVYNTVDVRQGEPDILLCTEFKNMAAYDTPIAQLWAFQAKLTGTVAKGDKEEAARGSIRTMLGDVLFRELKLK